MSDLRAPCEHGRYEDCGIDLEPPGFLHPCPGGREITPDAWGITTWVQLLGSMRVAETGGDFAECADALAAAIGGTG